MLATLVPFYDKDRKVTAYSLLTQRNNFLLNPQYLGTGRNDGAGEILGLEVIHAMGINTISSHAKIMMRITEFNLYTDISEKCLEIPHERIILLLNGKDITEAKDLDRIIELKKQGFLLALRKLHFLDYKKNLKLLGLMNYFLFDAEAGNMAELCKDIHREFPQTSICAYNVNTLEMFEKLKEEGYVSYFEGSFHRVPCFDCKDLMPIKTTLIELLNEVNNSKFDLNKSAKIISKDAALTIELIKTVNHMTMNHGISTINHAAAMLGQNEFIRWINTVVAKKLCSDRPSEIMRVCLLRAKFMEQLATLFHMEQLSDEFYLAGLFSVMDVILDIPEEEVFHVFHISDNIKNALLKYDGPIALAYELMEKYEDADWQGVSRILLLNQINDSDLYKAYLNVLNWYNKIINIK